MRVFQSIANKIRVGFVGVALLLTGVAGFSVYQVDELSDMFSDYRGTARQTLTLGEFSEQVNAVRRATMAYRLSPSQDAIDAVGRGVESLQAAAANARDVFKDDPERLQRLEDLADEIEAYSAAFTEMAQLQGRLDGLVEQLADAGRGGREALSLIVTSADADGDMRAAVVAGAAQQHLLLARLYAERFLLTSAPEHAARAESELEALTTALQRLEAELQNAERRRLAAEVAAFAGEFGAALLEVEEVVGVRNEIRDQRLDAVGPRVQAALVEMTTTIVDRQNDLGPAAADKMRAAVTVVLAVGGAATLLGLAFALLLPRLLTGLRGLKDAIEAISRQEADVEVPGRDRQDEVGAIANAIDKISASGAQAARVAAAVNASATAFAILNRKNAIVFGNAAFENLASAHAEAIDRLAPPAGQRRDASPLIAMFEDAKANNRMRVQQDGTSLYEIEVEGRTFGLKYVTVYDGNNDVIGSLFEMTDVTAVRKLEAEVVALIEDVERGEFHQRVHAIDDMGFTSFVAHGMNRLMDTISRFMTALDASLSSMADGDLTKAIDEEFSGDFETAKSAVNTNLEKLKDAIARIATAVGTVDHASGEISDSARRGAEGAEAQASNLEETAATMEEMSATIKATADNASQAADLATDAQNRAERGRKVVIDAVAAMGEIESGSERIGDIIAVIDGISFQTNLLALNAAVEAARAGDAGKGFAVVASEVRALAQKAAESASDIKQLIVESSNQVEKGVQLVNQTGGALDEINDAISKLSSMIDDISASGREQASGVEEINSAIAALDELTQRNAAVADQSSEQAKELKAEARSLSGLANSFKTESDAGGETREVA